MSKHQVIEHHGIVKSVEGREVSVRILQTSACAACAAAHLCHSSDTREKEVTAYCMSRCMPSVGEEVTVVGTIRQGLWATLWAYVVPLALLILILMIATSLTNSEGIGAVSALCSLIPYYIILYFLRDKFQRRLMFVIKDNIQ